MRFIEVYYDEGGKTYSRKLDLQNEFDNWFYKKLIEDGKLLLYRTKSTTKNSFWK